uniref:dedicator of cytokinesis protein 4 isoform X3 n=1 Tax=Myxine glutinosa TaxID=7769 RepID=UPI00358E5EA5
MHAPVRMCAPSATAAAMWVPTESEKFGVVVCGFSGALPYGLPVEVGDTVQILERCNEWYRGFNTKASDVKGVFPVSHVWLKKATVDNRGQYETVTPVEDPTVTEVTITLREWGTLWKQLYLQSRGDLFHRLRHVMQELFDMRRQILAGQLTADQLRDAKRHATARLDWGNEQLGLDLVPRSDYEMVDPDQISVTELYKLHASSRHNALQSLARSESRLGRSMQPAWPTSSTHHLSLVLRSFSCNVFGDEAEVFFFLYDARLSSPVSERFLVRLNRNGLPKSHERADRLCALFTDLGSGDIRQDVYLVAHVLRIGRMVADSRKAAGGAAYRRPFGCAVLSVAELLQGDSDRLRDEREFVLKVFTCSNESEWHQMHENIVKKSNTKYYPASSNYGILVALQLFYGDLDQVRRENPYIFTRGLAITRKLGFSEVIMPGDVRNEMYITLERGEFEKGGKSVQKNVEVTMYVLDVQGDILPDCICAGSGEPGVTKFRSFVLYHNNSPRWAEPVKLPLPIERFRGAHLRFEFRHCSTKDKGERKLFAFSFTPLMHEDGSTLTDTLHELLVYKCDESLDLSNPSIYLCLRSSKDQQNGAQTTPASLNGPVQLSARESFFISTILCSTKLTQNGVLLGLLKWKANSNQLVDILPQLRHMHGGEIVKFLQDILDTLFAILDESPEKYSTLVFQALVHIINLLRDAKFHNFRPVMDMYIQKHFAGALAYRELLRCLQWYLDRSVGAERQDSLQEALKALEYLFKFVVQSRRLFVQATGGRDEDDFRGSICAFFRSVQCCLAQESKGADTVAYTQAAFLGSFPGVYGELMRLLGPREVAGLVRDTLGSLPGLLHVAQVLRGAQLQCVGQTVQSQLFACPEARRILLPVVLRYLHSHLQHQQELPLCASILGTLFSIIKRDSTALLPVSDELDLLAATLPEVLVCILVELLGRSRSSATHRASHEATNIVGEYVSCLLSLLRQMADTHFQQLLESFSNREHLREFLQQIFRVFQFLLQPDIYPRDWMAMRTVTNNVIITTMQYLSSALHTHFVNDSFDFKVWSSYFTLAVMFINQPSLQLEKFSPAKRKKMLDRYGDMRVMMGYEIFSMWQNLGEHKMHFIPGMIGPFLGVTLVPQSELRSVMIPIFHDMIDWEQRRYGSLKQVEAELVDKLDSLVAEGKGDENYRELFSLLLLEKIEQETWRESGISFVTSVTRLMERLLDYRDCMTGGDVEDKKIGCTVNLLNFYKHEINKEEMYIRYIHKLFDLHRQANNSTEAAFALGLYAEQLSWDERPLQEILHYPSQMERQRRELLYLEIIHYFDLGKSWENAIHLCQELASLYQARYDYRRLSKIRKMEAGFYDNIMEEQRLEPEFFRIGFYGRKFPFFLRNKEFVCRGHDYERLEAFQQRMLSEFPQAVAMQNANTPDESVLNSDTQQLQIYAVTPVPRNLDVLQANFVPDCVKFHYRTNGVRRFRYDRPFHRGPRDKDNEFKSLWIERTTLILTHSLPGISRWFEVESRDVVFVSPLENAIQALENKAQELRSLVSQYQIQEREQGGQPGTLTSIQPLSMSLNGVIDAAVNGGISRYQEAFFLKEYVENHPEDWDRIVRLRELMHEQVHILREGLSVHDKLVTQDMRPLHNKLLEQFQVMQNSLMEQDSVWQARLPCGFHSQHSVSPDLLKHLNRHSPMNLMGLVRHSGSSLSSQTSTDAGGIFWMSDSTGGDGSDECFSHKMQVSPSTSSLVSIQSAPGQVFSAAPYSNHASPLFGDPRGSLALPSSLLLLPKERPASALYPPTYERKQMNMQQSLLQQVRGPGKPNSDPNLSTGDRAVTPAPSSWSLDGHSREHCIHSQSHSPIPLPVQRLPLTPVSPPVPPRTGEQGNEQVTNLAARPMRKMPLQPIPASPTETHASHSHRLPSRALTRSPSCCSSPLPSSDYAVYTTHAHSGYRKHGCHNAPDAGAVPLRRSGGLNAHEVDRHRRDYAPQGTSRFGLSELARDRSPSSPANCLSQPCRSISLPLGGNVPSDAVPPPTLPPKPRGSRRASDGGWNEDGMPIPLPRKLPQVGERGKT